MSRGEIGLSKAENRCHPPYTLRTPPVQTRVARVRRGPRRSRGGNGPVDPSSGQRSPGSFSDPRRPAPNARSASGGPGCRCSRPLFCPLCRIPPIGCKADRDRTDGALGVRPLPRARCGVRRIRKQSSGLFSRRTPGAQAEGRAVDAADPFSAPDAASRRWGANLTATEPTGLLGCDHCRARPGGAVRARSDLLWANPTGEGTDCQFRKTLHHETEQCAQYLAHPKFLLDSSGFQPPLHRNGSENFVRNICGRLHRSWRHERDLSHESIYHGCCT